MTLGCHVSCKHNLEENKKIAVIARDKITQLKKTHKIIVGRFFLHANENTTIDIVYLNEGVELNLGVILTDTFSFSDYQELSKPMADFLWDLCIDLQRHYGRGDYAHGMMNIDRSLMQTDNQKPIKKWKAIWVMPKT